MQGEILKPDYLGLFTNPGWRMNVLGVTISGVKSPLDTTKKIVYD